MEQKKSYYAIIPANVRYDKKLKANAKLLYGEITALANEKGYCWATNNYFAELYEVQIETISRWISDLEKNGYVKTIMRYKENSKEIEQRRIYINNQYPIDEKINTPLTEKSIPYCQNNQYPIDEKVKDNNTFNNTTNNTKEYSSHFEELWKMYPAKKGKGRISDSKKKELFKLGDELKRCITRYTDEVEKKRLNGFKELQYQNGSTFFNSGYIDYLDENYKEMGADGEYRGHDSKDEYNKLGWTFEDMQEM